MPRPKMLEINQLNIKIHPKHDPALYRELWKMLYGLRRPIVSRGGNALMIGEMRPVNGDGLDGYIGELYRFVQINPDDPWFDIDKHEKATPDRVSREVVIPSNLRPNLTSLPYYFDPRRHRLYFIAYAEGLSMSVGSVERLLQNLVTHPRVTRRFESVEVQMATERADVDALLTWPVLRTLDITVERPNADDFTDEEEVLRSLEERRLARERRSYTKAPEAPTIVPDEEMKLLARVAADNGVVKVSGIDHQRKSKTANSRQFPWSRKVKYEDNLQTMTGTFRAFLTNLLE